MTDNQFYTTRRQFLTGSLGFLSAAATMPVFLGRSTVAFAAPGKSPARDASGRILVVVQLSGGNDGLNTVVPYADDRYYKARPRLAIGADRVLRLDDRVGLHPAAEGLKSLFDDGRLAIVQGVGYPNPNRSHFVSMDVWHSGDPEARKSTGWLGRYVDACCSGDDPGAAPDAGVDPLNAIGLMNEPPLALSGERFTPLVFDNIDELTWRAGRRDARAAAAFRKLNEAGPTTALSAGDTEQFLQRAALEALVATDRIRTAAGRDLRVGPQKRRRGGGGGLTQQLDLVGKMIRADLPTRIYYVSLGGFDTHAGQPGRHQQLLRQFGDALDDFVGDLETDGLSDRVVVLAFSEFGRRVHENASNGTDHGEAAPVFIAGSRVRAGVHGGYPDFTHLNRGDLPYECDFRRVYAGLLRGWLGASERDVARVLGGGFGKPLRVV